MVVVVVVGSTAGCTVSRVSRSKWAGRWCEEEAVSVLIGTRAAG